MKAPQLYETLRRFCLGAFAAFHAELDAGAELPFAFEEHGSFGRPTLYEYRLLVRTAEGCGGFDWDDAAYDRAYAELEAALYGDGHAYGAVAPLVGISAGSKVDLGGGVRVRAAVPGELAAHWPEATGLLPPGFGRE